MVYQDFALCGNLDVASNIYLGRWPTRGVFVRAGRMEVEARRILAGLGVDAGIARQKVETLSGGRQQMVAIARAISFDPRLVILDEPTANLSVTATEHVLALVRSSSVAASPRSSSATGCKTSSPSATASWCSSAVGTWASGGSGTRRSARCCH